MCTEFQEASLHILIIVMLQNHSVETALELGEMCCNPQSCPEYPNICILISLNSLCGDELAPGLIHKCHKNMHGTTGHPLKPAGQEGRPLPPLQQRTCRQWGSGIRCGGGEVGQLLHGRDGGSSNKWEGALGGVTANGG